MDEKIMEIIINAGEIRYYAHEALSRANEGRFEETQPLLQKSLDYVEKAHELQNQLLFSESRGEDVPVTLLLMHAEDHFMNAVTERNLIIEMIALRRQMEVLKSRLPDEPLKEVED